MTMDMPGQDFLSRSAFALNQNGRRAGRHHLQHADGVQHFRISGQESFTRLFTAASFLFP